MKRHAVASAIAVLVLASRFCHLDLLWVEEAYGLAAARELLRGRTLYSDIWFDKPPVYAWFYALCGGEPGLPLRLLDTSFLLFAAWCAWLAARALWTEREGLIAAGLFTLNLVFWIPSAVMAVTPDQLLLPPFCLAIWAAARGRPWLSGLLAGVAVLCNSKGLIVLPVAAAFAPAWWPVVAGLAVVQAASVLLLPIDPYWREVWVWGAAYSADTFLSNPLREGVVRTAGWIGFHLTAVAGTVWTLARERNWRYALWIALSVVAVAGGLRFFPRYYFALLPAFAILGARGLALLPRRQAIAISLLLLIPIVRFGPRYVTLALHGPAGWSDAGLMLDSREAARIVASNTEPGDPVLIWGYRPDIAVWSTRPQATPWLDSQPLTGVLADRHLTLSRPTFPEIGAENRRKLVDASPPPAVLVDGLGPINPELAPQRFPDLAPWLSRYERIGATNASVIYRLKR